MLTPQMPFMFVLAGDNAAGQAERLLSSLKDHVSSRYYPVLQVLCLYGNKMPASQPNGIHMQSYSLRDMGERVFASIVAQVQKDIMNRAGDLGDLGINSGKMCISFVVRGTEVAAATLFRFRQEAEDYLRLINCDFKCQLCYLAEDDPVHFTSQAEWLRDPECITNLKPGFRNFNHFLILSGRQCNGNFSYETRNQREEAYPLGLLAAANPMLAGNESYLLTMRYGKINGSHYEVNRLLGHSVADALEKWASRTVNETGNCEIISTGEMIFTGAVNREEIIRAVESGIEPILPGLADLAAVGLTGSGYSMEELVLSFEDLNGPRLFSAEESRAWAEKWRSEVRGKLNRYPFLDSLVNLLKDDGALGREIHDAWVEADIRVKGIESPGDWLRQQWNNIEYPQGRLLEKEANRNLRCLQALLPACQRLLAIRGTAARLAALDSQRRELVREMQGLAARRSGCLKKFRLDPAEAGALRTLCAKFWEDINRGIGSVQIESMPCYHVTVQEINDPVKLESSWLTLFQALQERAAAGGTSRFTDAFATGLAPAILEKKITDHPSYNDKTLLSELPANGEAEIRTLYLAADNVCQKLPTDPAARNFVSIPGDMIERVSLVSLSPAECLLDMNMFKPYALGGLPEITSAGGDRAEGQADTAVSAGSDDAGRWNVTLLQNHQSWWLHWKWIGSPEHTTKIYFNGQLETVTYDQWRSNERYQISEGKIPYGRFEISIRCGDITTRTELLGKQIDVSIEKHREKPLKLLSGDKLQGASIELSGGNLAQAMEHCLLKKSAGARSFVYDLFSICPPDETNSFGPVYYEDGAMLTLEGRGAMRGHVNIK